MLTEFGAVGQDSVSLDGVGFMLKAADEHLQSWAYWNFKSYDDITTEGSPSSETLYRPDGSLQSDKLRALKAAPKAAKKGKQQKKEASAVEGSQYTQKPWERNGEYEKSYE